MFEDLKIRSHGSAALPCLIYLPGLHGNWKLIGGFRKALRERVRFVEITYPNTTTWSLDQHAAAFESAMAAHGISSGWLLGESFSSQVVWSVLGRKNFDTRGSILAGGFVRHPFRWVARLAHRGFFDVSFSVLSRVFYLYAWLTPFRFRRAPETFAEIREYIAGLTPSDVQAFKHRLHLLAENDPCSLARQTDVPVYALTGLLDPVVPWFWVRKWLKANCPALQQYRIIWRADHNVLGTAPDLAAQCVLNWMGLH